MTARPLQVIVVGAGIGGLAAAVALRRTGAEVIVLEQAARLGEVGAGVQLAPNATRALEQLGVQAAIGADAVAATGSLRRRWQDARVLGRYDLGPAVEEFVGAPYWHAHRADLHAALLSAAAAGEGVADPVRVRLGQRVLGHGQHDDRPWVATDGGVHDADVVIAADGIHSQLREAVAGHDEATFSGDVAYRAVIPRDELTDPCLRELVAETELNIWLGPDTHIVHYYVRRATLLNVVVIVPGESDTPESWSSLGDKAMLRTRLAGWAPQIEALIEAAPVFHRSAIWDRAPLDRWVQHRLALLGDSCHPMLPYQAQGAAQALEDAVALGAALDGVPAERAPEALLAYEATRRVRASAVQRASWRNRELFHLHDGPRQRARDEQLAVGDGDFASYAWLWTGTDPPAQYLTAEARR